MKPSFLQTILTDDTNFKQFQSVNILEGYLKTGQMIDFLGLTWRTHPDLDDSVILMYEKDTCLKYYEETGSSIVESQKIISQQLQETVCSVVFAFGKMFDHASHYKTKKV
jgi:hypothetical protein